MYLEQITETIFFHLQNIALLSFNRDSDYKDIISPFTRLYLVTEGMPVPWSLGICRFRWKPETCT